MDLETQIHTSPLKECADTGSSDAGVLYRVLYSGQSQDRYPQLNPSPLPPPSALSRRTQGVCRTGVRFLSLAGGEGVLVFVVFVVVIVGPLCSGVGAGVGAAGFGVGGGVGGGVGAGVGGGKH